LKLVSEKFRVARVRGKVRQRTKEGSFKMTRGKLKVKVRSLKKVREKLASE
jgi:hypothetical protein